MAQFTVKTDIAKAQADAEQRWALELDKYAGSVRRIADNLPFSSSKKAEIQSRINAVADRIEEQSESLQAMGRAIDGIMNSYEKAEERALPSKVSVRWVDTADKALEFVYKGFSSPAAGPLGTLISLVHNDMKGNTGKEISDFIKLAGGTIKNWNGSGINWRDWFGLNTSTKTPWQSAIGKYFDFSSVKKGISSACSWASTLIERGFSNYDEFGNFGARFWEETIVETGIKVVEGVAISWAAATGVSAAPAVIVGIVSAGVTVAVDAGLNALVRWKTENAEAEWLEVASDFISDKMEAFGREIKKEVAEFKDDLKKTVSAVGDGIAKGVNAVKNLVGSSCRWGKVQMAEA